MPRRAEGLHHTKVQNAGPGRYGDGGGLYLLVREVKREGQAAPDLAKFWVFRFVRAGRMREMGLGPASGRTSVTLADARKKARALLDLVRDGRDPLAEKAAERAAAALEAAKLVTFRQCGEAYVIAHRDGWRNAKHADQWTATLETYVYPRLGSLPVASVDTGLVLNSLQPIWSTIPETASRVRGRIESILDWAKARGYRDGENPARWRGHLDNLLPKRSKVARIQHQPALPFAEAGLFMAALRARESTSALALEFLILTAARTGEVIGARLSEVDELQRMWIVPGERMKAGKEHRVPLSARALEIVATMKERGADEYLFPGGNEGRPLSNMALSDLLRGMKREDGAPWSARDGVPAVVHGFRSTFRDWAAERTSFPNEMVEIALAHAVADKTEAAYRRGDMVEKRRRLMEAWARFCVEAPRAATQKNVVTPLREAVQS